MEHSGRGLARITFLFLIVGLLAGPRKLGGIEIRLMALPIVTLCAVAMSPMRREQRISRSTSSGVTLILLYFSWMSVSYFWAPDQGASIVGLTQMLFLALFAVVSAVCARHLTIANVEFVLKFMVLVSLIYFGDAMRIGPGNAERFAAFGGGPNVFVRVMVFGVFASGALARFSDRRFVVVIPFLSLGALLSGSRGGLLGLVIACVVTFSASDRRGQIFRRAMAVAPIVVVSIIYLLHVLVPKSLNTLNERFLQATIRDKYTSDRDIIFSQTWQLFVDHPVFGIGIRGFNVLIGDRNNWPHAHNFFLATAAEGGLVGLSLALLAIRKLSRNSSPQEVRNSGYAAVLRFLGVYVLAASLFSGDYYDTRFAWFFLIASQSSTLNSPQFSPSRVSPSRILNEEREKARRIALTVSLK